MFEECFISWVKSFQICLEDKVIAIDGKTSRYSFDCDNKSMHMVSAFASELGIVLGQYKTSEKSNEITAIPELINLLDIKDSIITIDAMVTQHKIAKQIIQSQADYVLALKGNQSALQEDVITYFSNIPKGVKVLETQTCDKAHGRLEIRHCRVIKDIDWLRQNHPLWDTLRTIIEIESIREIKSKKTTEKRYYISSADKPVEELLKAIRSHLGYRKQVTLEI